MKINDYNGYLLARMRHRTAKNWTEEDLSNVILDDYNEGKLDADEMRRMFVKYVLGAPKKDSSVLPKLPAPESTPEPTDDLFGDGPSSTDEDTLV